MSGDADTGTSIFSAKDSTITTNKGDTIFVTNTTATINLENNKIVNNDGDFLRIQTGKWGSSGSNGGDVTLNLINQKINGNINVDSISTLDINLSNGSIFEGTINNNDEAKEISLTLSSDSVIILTNDSYIDSLTNEVSDNSNIYLNGYKLYVNGSSVDGNNEDYTSTTGNDDVTTTNNLNSKNNNNYTLYIIGGVVLVIVIGTIIVIVKKKKD